MMLTETLASKPDWILLQGKTLDGGYELLSVLEAKDSSAHFGARVLGDSSIAAYASFYLAEDSAAAEQLQLWHDLRGLKHRNLKTPFASGRFELNGVSTVYAVSTMPDETLSEILGDRALADEEGRELFKSLGEGLLHLHSHGYAHGALSPQMVVSVGGCIRISSECIRRINSHPKLEIAIPRYTAPEVTTANVTMAADVWCLGATVYESLVQKKYDSSAFDDLKLLGMGSILQRCLDPDPNTRARLTELIDSPDANRAEILSVPRNERLRRVETTRKPVGTKRVRLLDPSETSTAAPELSDGEAHLRSRVKPTGAAWHRIVPAAGLVLLLIVIWLVIIPRFRSTSNATPATVSQVQKPQEAWPTKTIGGTETPPPAPAPAPVPVPQKLSGQTWRLVLGSYKFEADANRRIKLLNQNYPQLVVEKLTKSVNGPFFVVTSPMAQSDADELRNKAIGMGLSRACYVTKF